MAESFLTLMADYCAEDQQRMSVWYDALQNAGFTGTQTPGLNHHISLATFPLEEEEAAVALTKAVAARFAPVYADIRHVGVFPGGSELSIIGMSACLAGSVCGDHCSPISDTTIMSSAGAQCEHVNHVSTQLPYAITVAGVSFVSYIIAGFVQSWYITLPIAMVLLLGTMLVLRTLQSKREA